MTMFRYFKSQPTDYVFHFKGSRVKKQGPGLSFLYYVPTSNIVSVPLSNQDQPFIFREVTSDFQEVTVQGNLTYRITDPVAISKALNFSLNEAAKAYASDDPEKLATRTINRLQVIMRSYTQSLSLTEVLELDADTLATIHVRLAESDYLSNLGIEVLDLSITAIKPTPETAEALQTRERERLLQEADDAIYIRRNAAVEAERKIRENELETEQAVEEKKREIQEVKLEGKKAEQKKRQEMATAQMNANIELEKQRDELVKLNAENEKVEAESASYKLAKQLEPINQLSPEVVQALSAMRMEPSQLIARSFVDFAANAEKIGSLNISQDVISELLNREQVS
ncbi:SPFH domain-containing protein [Aliikangiella coralliicola]|uniref:SPFH domain-containing protein n=1 Tax=Aliikangiella coralliicola TaxID=2592383 RepID=A0A545UEY3_9GAMM|nr:SPFH domain-containing protein [Aliikangiella coralliicola]TQV88024.1 SPFH domain-containing protein [Aliikangiella coralliicola]